MAAAPTQWVLAWNFLLSRLAIYAFAVEPPVRGQRWRTPPFRFSIDAHAGVPADASDRAATLAIVGFRDAIRGEVYPFSAKALGQES